MTEVSKLVLFVETSEIKRSEMPIYVEDIGEFIRWWVSTPAVAMKIEVTGEFKEVDPRMNPGNGISMEAVL